MSRSEAEIDSTSRIAAANDVRLSRICLAVGFGATIALGIFSSGAYHDDDLTHFLMARWSSVFPGYLLNIWGRPGYTLPAAAVAWIGDPQTGWHALRVLSALVTALSAALAARIARRLQVAPAWLVIAFCYLQPLNMQLAATTLTENFAALYLIGAIHLLLRGRLIWASAVFSLVLVSRHETIALLPVWWLAVILSRGSAGRRHSRMMNLVAMPVAWSVPLLHNLAFYGAYGAWPVRLFLQPGGSTQYPPTGALAYLPQMFFAVTPVIAGLAVFGAPRVALGRCVEVAMIPGRSTGSGQKLLDMLSTGAWIIPGLAAAYLLIHSAVLAGGVFASGGYARFMVTAAPLVAILAAAGLMQACSNRYQVAMGQKTSDVGSTAASSRASRIWLVLAIVFASAWLSIEVEHGAGRLAYITDRALAIIRLVSAVAVVVCLASLLLPSGAPRRISRRLAAALMLLLTFAQSAAVIRPLRFNHQALAAGRVADWIRQSDLDDRLVFATNSWFAYYFNWAEDPQAHKGRRLLASMPVGSIVIWDSVYSGSDFHRIALTELDSSPAYRRIHEMEGDGTNPIRFVLFEKVGATPMPVEPDVSYPPNLTNQRHEVLGAYYIR